MKGIIYKATNILNNQVYIGATTRPLEDRIHDHHLQASNGNGHYFHQAISTYGYNSFVWKQIDSAATIDELAAKEIKYILENNSVTNGYNSDKGGGFKKSVFQYNLDGSLAQSYSDLESAANAIKTTKKAISKACWNVNQMLGGFFWSYELEETFTANVDNRKKKVRQYVNDGKFVAEYGSAAEASRQTGILKSCITKCCRGERKQSGGFCWRYV